MGDFPVIHSDMGIYGLVLTGEIGGVSLKLFINVTLLLSLGSSVISTSGQGIGICAATVKHSTLNLLCA